MSFWIRSQQSVKHVHPQTKLENSLVHATSSDRTSTRVCKGNWTPNICFLSLPMTLQSDQRESQLRFDTIKKKIKKNKESR